MKLAEIIQRVEKEIPLSYQESYDRSGLQVGARDWDVTRVLFAYDACHEVVREAKKSKAQLIVTHHPLSMRDYRQIDLDTYEGQLIAEAIQSKIAIYSLHTNHDASPHSLNRFYAQKLGLKKIRVINPSIETPFCKLIVYVPKTHSELVMEALFSAGGGQVGNYSHCSFRVEGRGTFKGSKNTNPFIGTPGVLEQTVEDRLEIVLEVKNLDRVIEKMLLAHPYEEVAYDIVPLTNVRSEIGQGIMGVLESGIKMQDLLPRLKKIFGISKLVFIGDEKRKINSIGICTGSGTSLLNQVIKNQVDLFITGDVKYHYAIEALRRDLCLVDVGHFPSEIHSVDLLRDLFDRWFEKGLTSKVYRGLKNPLKVV